MVSIILIIQTMLILILGYFCYRLLFEEKQEMKDLRNEIKKLKAGEEKTHFEYIVARFDPSYSRNWHRSGKYRTLKSAAMALKDFSNDDYYKKYNYEFVILPFQKGKYIYSKEEVENLRIKPY